MPENTEIRVLSGIHAGAKALVAGPRTTIGSADDCDVVLMVDDVLPHHAAVLVGDAGLRVAPLEGEVIRADGQPVRDEEPLAAFEPIRLGSTVVACGPAGGPWPRIDLSSFSGTRTPTPAASERAPPVLPAAERRPSPWRSRQPYLMAVLLAAGIAFVATLKLGAEESSTAGAAPPPPPSVVDTVAARIRELGLQERLSVRPVGTGTVLVTGYVELSEQITSLSEQLKVENVDVVMRVWAEDQLVRAARERLAGMASTVSVRAGRAGTLHLTGLAVDDEVRTRMVEVAREDVPGVREVANELLTLDELATRLNAAIAASPLARRVKVGREGDSLVAKGDLGEADLPDWSALLERATAELKVVPPLRTAFVPRPDALPFTIRSVVNGPLSYVVVDSGRRVTQGGELAEGYRLVSIAADHIVIRHAGQTFAHRLKE